MARSTRSSDFQQILNAQWQRRRNMALAEKFAKPGELGVQSPAETGGTPEPAPEVAGVADTGLGALATVGLDPQPKAPPEAPEDQAAAPTEATKQQQPGKQAATAPPPPLPMLETPTTPPAGVPGQPKAKAPKQPKAVTEAPEAPPVQQQPGQPAQPPGYDPQMPPEAPEHTKILSGLRELSPMLRGARIHLDKAGVMFQMPQHGGIRVRYERDGEIAGMSQKFPEALGQSQAAGGTKALPHGFYWNREIVLSRAATPDVMAHEIIHGMQDLGLITRQEVEMFGGNERIAYAYQKWVADGRHKTKSGILERVGDFLSRTIDALKATFGSQEAMHARAEEFVRVHGDKPIGKSAEASAAKGATPLKITKNKLRNLDFKMPDGGASISPKRAFDIRDSGDYETLKDLAAMKDSYRFKETLGKGYDAWKPSWELMLKRGDIANDAIRIPIFRAVDDARQEVGAAHILPGAYVSQSRKYVEGHAKNILGMKEPRIIESEASPSELMTYGDPHEFIYLPSIEAAHKRLTGKDPAKRPGAMAEASAAKDAAALQQALAKPKTDGVAEAAKIALAPPESVTAQLLFGKEDPIDVAKGVHSVTTARGKTYTFDAHTFRLSDGRERVILSAGDPHELVDAAAVIRKVEGGVIVETIHAGVTGFKGLGGVLAKLIHRKYGKIIADPDAPLSAAGKKATQKLLAKETADKDVATLTKALATPKPADIRYAKNKPIYRKVKLAKRQPVPADNAEVEKLREQLVLRGYCAPMDGTVSTRELFAKEAAARGESERLSKALAKRRKT